MKYSCLILIEDISKFKRIYIWLCFQSVIFVSFFFSPCSETFYKDMERIKGKCSNKSIVEELRGQMCE